MLRLERNNRRLLHFSGESKHHRFHLECSPWKQWQRALQTACAADPIFHNFISDITDIKVRTYHRGEKKKKSTTAIINDKSVFLLVIQEETH